MKLNIFTRLGIENRKIRKSVRTFARPPGLAVILSVEFRHILLLNRIEKASLFPSRCICPFAYPVVSDRRIVCDPETLQLVRRRIRAGGRTGDSGAGAGKRQDPIPITIGSRAIRGTTAARSSTSNGEDIETKQAIRRWRIILR